MKFGKAVLFLVGVCCTVMVPPGDGVAAASGEHVVLLHGLGRTGRSMKSLGRFFEGKGYQVSVIDYPSRKKTLEELAGFLKQEMEARDLASAERVHFITHSMGGIVLRTFFNRFSPENMGRVVMIAPPNKGSEIVDTLGGNPVFRWALGPAAQQLGTEPESFVNRLGPVAFDLGVITGDKSYNPLFSSWIDGPNDGKVSTFSARVEGMADFMVVHMGHTFLMKNDFVAEQALFFIRNGRFQPQSEKYKVKK